MGVDRSSQPLQAFAVGQSGGRMAASTWRGLWVSRVGRCVCVTLLKMFMNCDCHLFYPRKDLVPSGFAQTYVNV